MEGENVESSEALQVYGSFEGMGLRDELYRGVICYGFEKPSAVQQRAILPIVQGRDVIVQSQSGTGKTAVFTIAALQRLDLQTKHPQVLILSPTRELSEQTQMVARALGKYMKVQAHSCIGGTSVSEDVKALERGVHLVSGTPGRVKEMIMRRALNTAHIRLLILDEAD
jgi:ATP-dependent RNA helicase